MTKKSKRSESKLPSDKFTMTDGMNYGLDGFDFDVEAGGGVSERARLPSVRGLAGLPEDLIVPDEASDMPSGVKNADADFDLSEMLEENSLAGLGWLHGEQDPDRLPKNPVDRGIMELEEAWGVNRRTQGIIPNRDKEVADFERSLQEKSASNVDEETLQDVVFRAHRRSAFGHPIESIMKEAVQSLGHNVKLIAEDLQDIKEEHGLAGNVFIYEAAFKGLKNGKWKKALRKKCSTCRYLVSSDQSLSKFTNLKVVERVPWKEALSFYRTQLKASGRLAKEGSAKEVLRTAFLSYSQDLSPKKTQRSKPVDVRPSERISSQEAREQFSQHKPSRKVLDNSKKNAAAQVRKAQAQLNKWVVNGFLSKEVAAELMASEDSPHTILRTASALISQTKSGRYSEAQYTRHQSESRKNVKEDQASVTSRQAHKQQQRVLKAYRNIKAAIDNGVRGTALITFIRRSINREDVRVASKLINPLLQETQAHMSAPQEKAEYKGAVEHRHVPQRKRAKVEVKSSRIVKAASWIRRQMTEGWAGRDLTSLIQAKFAPHFLETNKEEIASIRKAHEGLSGHLYVDAEAYASPEGTEGCEKGANIHRANAVPSVMKMARCGGCVFANKCDGAIVCQKYNKVMTASVPVEDPASYQREMIRMANSSDAEQTASLFAPSYDENEFTLHNAALEGFELEDDILNSDLQGIFFGGIDLE